MSGGQQIVIPGGVTLAADLDGTGMLASPFPAGDFDLVVSGPPGGPLSFLVWRPSPDERDAADGIERSIRRTFRLPAGPLDRAALSRVSLAGAEREALCFVESQGFARVGWCVARIDHAGASALVAFGCSVGSEPLSCDRMLSHPSLHPIASTLRVVT